MNAANAIEPSSMDLASARKSESEQEAEQQECSEMFNIMLETGLGPFCGRYDRQYHQGQCKTNCAETNELS